MSFEHRQIHQQAGIKGTLTDIDVADGRPDGTDLVLFQVKEGDRPGLADLIISGPAHGAHGVIADPAALDDTDVTDTVFPEIGNASAEDAGMGGRTALRRAGNDQIGLECHGTAGGHQTDGIRCGKQLKGHFMGVLPVNLINFPHCFPYTSSCLQRHFWRC